MIILKKYKFHIFLILILLFLSIIFILHNHNILHLLNMYRVYLLIKYRINFLKIIIYDEKNFVNTPNSMGVADFELLIIELTELDQF